MTRRAGALVAAAVAVAWLRLGLTWPVFTQTYDEGLHLAAGLEWCQQGTYRFDILHPPLSRILVGVLPSVDGTRFEAGARPASVDAFVQTGNDLLHQQDHYQRTLVLARAGLLPMVALLIVATAAWGAALGGPAVGVAAAWVVSLLPPILAHGGLATTDLTLAATLALTWVSGWAWLARPGGRAAVATGVAAGLALASKLTALVWAPASLVALAAVQLVTDPAARRGRWRRWLAQAPVVAAPACGVLWAFYRFEVGPLDGVGAHVPAPAYVAAWRALLMLQAIPRPHFALGEVYTGGRWWYFPLVLAVKTPVAVLVLGAASAGLALRRRIAPAVPLALAGITVVVVGSAMTGGTNMGVRHVLPVYVPLAIAAAATLGWAWQAGRAARPAAVALAAWLAMDGVRAHPDYLAWFSPVAGRDPEGILLDSDLDWGQDLGRLARALPSLGVDTVWIAYGGSADLGRAGLPPFRVLPEATPVTGWVAISATRRGFRDYRWLDAHLPVARVGRTWRLYRVSRGDARGTG